MEEKKLGLGSVISVSVGLVIATSCPGLSWTGSRHSGRYFYRGYDRGLPVEYDNHRFSVGIECADAQHNRRIGAVYAGSSWTVPDADFHGRRIFILQRFILRCGGIYLRLRAGGSDPAADSDHNLYDHCHSGAADRKLKWCRYVCQSTGCGNLSHDCIHGYHGDYRCPGSGNRRKSQSADEYDDGYPHHCVHDSGGILAFYRRRICDSGIQKKSETQNGMFPLECFWDLASSVWSSPSLCWDFTITLRGRNWPIPQRRICSMAKIFWETQEDCGWSLWQRWR